MVLFVFKFVCIILFLTEAVSPRTLASNYEMDDKIDNVFISGLLQNMLDKKPNSRKVVNVSDMSKIIANVTEKVALLKHQKDSGLAAKTCNNKVGNIDKYIENSKYTYAHAQDTTNPSLLKNVFHYEIKKTTTEAMPTVATDYPDYLGTAQLEELLNDIKARAIEMVAENPTVADLITNTVTEATFEADPILNHLDISSPGYALSTFVFLSDVDNTNKRTAKDFGMIHIAKRNNERLPSGWCCKKSFAQSLEDTLQSKLKEAYHKVRTKVTKDYKKEMGEVKATLEKEVNKIVGSTKKPECKPKCKPKCKPAKFTKPSKKPCPKKLTDTENAVLENSIKEWTTKSMNKEKYAYTDKIPTPTLTTNKIRNVRAEKLKLKKSQKVKSTSPTSTSPTVDDFAMLTLYEQILSKTHESNLMNLMATNSRRTNEVTRLSKRNPETLSDLRLKKDVKRKYDDEDNMPDADSSLFNSLTTETQVEGTSYQALRDKIAFKDYVNGYKSYLDFQKKQGTSDKFSNLVKYQAHKHHKVEDIGKFILEKIPPVPAKDVTKRRKRNFFDIEFEKNKDLEDLDMPNKSDSWFKRHFSIFDRNPPSKFRTSETVKFKEVTDAAETSKDIADSAVHESGTKKSLEMIKGNDINLDELSKKLESRKHKPSFSSLRFFSSTRLPSTRQYFDKCGDFQVEYKVHNPHPSKSQLLGKRRHTKPTDTNQKIQNKSPKYSEGDNFLFETNRRKKRKIMKSTQKIIDNDEKTIKSKINRNGYVTLVTQPTAIINLIKTNDGGNKVKKLLRKLHLHRNKQKRTKIKKEKRYCTRVQRFNPVKKLRKMFSGMEMIEPMALNKNKVPDYDMITSHIDTFKAVVYDKIPSMEELQKQVPNLSEDPYLKVTDNPGILEATEDSTTFTNSKIKVIQKKNHERKVLPSPKTFTVVLGMKINEMRDDMNEMVEEVTRTTANWNYNNPIAKLNKQPKQLFNSPMPMKNANFEKFLKDNNIDVESVTSNWPPYPANAANESQPDPVTHKTKLQITSEYNETLNPQNPTDTDTVDNIDYLIGKSYVESQKDYLNDLERSLNNDYNEIVNERRKRMTSLDDTDDRRELIGRAQLNKVKHHPLTCSKAKCHDATMKKQYQLKKFVKPKEDAQMSVINVNDFNNNEREEHVTEPLHPEKMAQNFTNILLDALNTLQSKTVNSKTDIKQDKSSKLTRHPTLVDPYSDEIGLLHDYRLVTKTERKATPAAAPNSATNSNTITNSLNSRLPTTHVETIHFGLTGPKSKNKRMFGLPFKGKAKTSMKTTKPTVTQSTTQMTKIAGIIDTSPVVMPDTSPVAMPDTSPVVLPVEQKQTEANHILDNKLGLQNYEYHSTAKPSTWSEQSVANSAINETTADTFSDLWDYPREEQKSISVEDSQDYLGRSLEQVLKAYLNKSRPYSDDTLKQLSFLLMSDDPTTDEAIDPDTASDDTTDSTVDFKSPFSEENSSPSAVTYRILKRDVDGELRTAKGVAALEIIVDLMKHKGGVEITNQTDTKLGAAEASESDDDIFTFRPPMNEPTDASTNSIQVHIAIPYDNTLSRKRSAEPVVARKVFSARLASPVDLEYQIHYIDSIKPTRGLTTSKTTQAEIVSPGLYLLVDNFNESNNSFALKPVKVSSVGYDKYYSVEKKARNASTKDVPGLKLSKAFLKAVNKHLVDLYNNITESNLNKRTTHVKREVVYPKYLKKVRGIFENNRACDCKCKVDEPMCRVCAASDAVIKELSFEFDNLGKYINDHCTEIQTYFKANPRGGKVLRDCVRRIDKSLDDYNKRNKGKCHGPTCKTFATYLHKRQNDRNSKTEEANLVNYVMLLNNNFNALSNLIPYVETLKNNGDNFIRSAKDCLVANVKKRKCRDAMNKDDVYTFDNISVKFICSPESTSDPNNMSPFDTAATDLMYMDYGFKKRSLKPNLLNKFFSRKKKQNNKLYGKKIMHKKRQVDQVESPLIADAGGSFWRNYILRKTTSKPNIIISVVESNTGVTDRTTEKDKQRDSGRSEIVGTSYNMGDLLNLIATNKTGDQESKSTPRTITSRFWMKKTKKTKTTKISKKKTDKVNKKKKKKICDHTKNTRQQNKAHTQYNIPQYNKTKPNVSDIDIIERTISEISSTDNFKSTLETIPPTTSFGNTFLKKIKMGTPNFLKEMKPTTEGYQLDLNDFMGHDEQREKRTTDMLTTKQTLQLISQKTVKGGKGKPRFVVVTKPITLNVNKMNKINDSKSTLLSMLNSEKKNKQNEKEKKLFGDLEDNINSTEEMDVQQQLETKFTTAVHTIGSWFQSDYSNGSLRTVKQLDKSKDDTPAYYDVFEELKFPTETEKDSSTVPCEQTQSYTMGKKKGLLAKNLRLVLRPGIKSTATFAPDAEKEHEHTETTKTTDITDATLSNVEEADPFKTRLAEISSSAFVPEPCFNSRCHYSIDRKENPREQDRNDISRDKENEPDSNQRYDNVRIYRRTNLRNFNGVDGRHFGKPSVKMKNRPGFDSYVRGDHGDYRIERDRRKTSTTSHVYVKMRKRSSSKLNTDLSSLSGWVHHVTISRLLATVLCFYLCCGALAAAVSRVFRT